MEVRRVLVVDDNEDMCVLLASFLRMAGWEVLTTTSGSQVLELAASNPIDAIMLDLQMPEMSGPEVFLELKKDPRTADIPCILFTCHVENLDKEHYLRLGFRGVLSKSFIVERLVGDISKMLGWDVGRP